ncbi:sporulation protein [Xylophilus rhododendri]|uniref:Sporulation protein n=1 Tax=Xylophilus rhododendri TaxID=2697032 RepID=A0A857JEZ8_9BURK|nr:SPOR domain-containing protein [Xylophilus rhododendri]QHJ01513.1 sporulation protein [Xylophilus rhododendri]
MKRQFGGTFLGIVIGVVLGLGAALAVAVYVTKVPIPFMNRNASRSAEQDAMEAQKNRDWDPNSILGKRAAGGKAADTGAAPAGAATGVVAPQAPKPDATIPAAPASAAATAATPASPRSAPASSDPLGDLARTRSAAAPSTSASAASAAPASGGADAFDYLIQAGAFRTEADAEAQRARLAIMGWEARVSEREQAGRTVYRVRIGPFTRRDDAERLKDTLDSSGMESSLVRVQR